MSALADLAVEAGLQPHWHDVEGRAYEVSEATLRALLAALALPADSEPQIAASRDALRAKLRHGAELFRTAWAGEEIALPDKLTGPAVLHLEGGASREVTLAAGRLGAIDEPGYHRLVHAGGETVVAVAPLHCFGIGDIAPERRLWGAAVQLPSLRGEGRLPFADFSVLGETARDMARAGADMLAISPVHAMFPADAGHFSPYSPSSRAFLNVLMCNPGLVGAHYDPDGADAELVEWEQAIGHRMAELRRIFEGLGEPCVAADDEELHRHALFDALDAHFRARGLHGWRQWPESHRQPTGDAVRAFAREHPSEVAFHAWLQQLAARSLAAAQDAAREAGMACGIVTDLAVGIDPGGSDAWRRPHAYLHGISIGAPPDPLGPEGQDWGLTTLNPHTLHLDHFSAFRATLAAAMRHAGGVRIDHILGLNRVWLVPEGRASSEGCYITFPRDDMLRILALESHRHRALVIGEDLGTVPAGLREDLGEAGVMGMRVLWFERGHDGGYTDPAGWTRQAAAMTSTHDLPTLAGWWCGRDIEWTWRIGRKSRFASLQEERDDRHHQRERIWAALVQAGHAEGDCPDADRPDAFVTAACAHVAASACDLALFPLEDLFGLAEQPNLPGTIAQHPNWRRRMPDRTGALLADPVIARRVAAIARQRRQV